MYSFEDCYQLPPVPVQVEGQQPPVSPPIQGDPAAWDTTSMSTIGTAPRGNTASAGHTVTGILVHGIH